MDTAGQPQYEQHHYHHHVIKIKGLARLGDGLCRCLQPLVEQLDHLPALLAGLEQRLGAHYMETVAEMKSQYDQMRVNVANQIQQLTDALVNAGTTQSAIDEVTAGMRDLNTKLMADDAIPPSV